MRTASLILVYLIPFVSQVTNVIFDGNLAHGDGAATAPASSAHASSRQDGNPPNLLSGVSPELLNILADNPQVVQTLRSSGVDVVAAAAATAAEEVGDAVPPNTIESAGELPGGYAGGFPGGIGGFGGVPYPFFCCDSYFHISGDFGSYIKKIMIVVGGGIFFPLILALITKGLSKLKIRLPFNFGASTSSSVDTEVEMTPVKFMFHFPEEVWEMILKDVTDDVDKTNCCRIFPYLDNLLTNSKPVWMFKQILPFIHDSLTNDDRLTCRLICKQWCDDIDNHTYLLHAPNLSTSFMWDWYFFTGVRKMNTFIQWFEGHGNPSKRSPFIDRTLCVRNYEEDAADEFLRRLLVIVSRFGRHVWTLLIVDFYPDNTPLMFYRSLRQVLANTPNLKQLILHRSCKRNGDATDNDYLRDPNLALYMAENPLPYIPSVEVFSLTTLSALPPSFSNMVVMPYAVHLKSIWIEWKNFGRVLFSQLPELTCLQIFGIPDDQGLETLLQLTAPLKELKICEGSPEDGSFISIAGLLRVFQHFSRLEQVTVEGIVETRVEFDDLKNSTVRQLNFIFLDDGRDDPPGLPISFRFLGVFQALEELTVRLSLPRKRYLEKNEREEDVQLYKMLEEGQLYESNIWTVLKSLKTVHIFCRHVEVAGNRKQFVEYQKIKLDLVEVG